MGLHDPERTEHNVPLTSKCGQCAYESDEEIESGLMFGVKHECPLNCLDAFHSIGGFPPDCLHDLLEGVVSQDLLGVIRILSSKKWFTVDEYNKSLKSLKYKFYWLYRVLVISVSAKYRFKFMDNGEISAKMANIDQILLK